MMKINIKRLKRTSPISFAGSKPQIIKSTVTLVKDLSRESLKIPQPKTQVVSTQKSSATALNQDLVEDIRSKQLRR
jgi:hypothetical protein